MISGNALKRARAFLGFTQAEMAEAMGISRRTYQAREALAEEAIPLAEGAWALTLARDTGKMMVERVILSEEAGE